MSKQYRIRSDVHEGMLVWYAESRAPWFFGKLFTRWTFVSGTVDTERSKSLSKLALILKSEKETIYLDADGKGME